MSTPVSVLSEDPPDLYRAIDQLTALKIEIQQLHRRIVAGDVLEPTVLDVIDRTIDDLTDALQTYRVHVTEH